MKNALKNVVTIAGILATIVGLNASAQNLPATRADWVAYALEHTVSVSGQIGSALPVGYNAYQYIPVSSPTVAGISNTIRDMHLPIDVINPNDNLYAYAGAYNASGDALFSGYHQFKLVYGKGGYTLPTNYSAVPLVLQDNIPVSVPGIQWANVAILNPDGTSGLTTELQVQNGEMYVPWRLSETNAILTVGAQTNGTNAILAWNTSTGLAITPEHFNTSLIAIIPGVVTSTDGPAYVVVPTTNGIGTNWVLELTATGKETVTVSFWTSEMKWFTGVSVRQANTTQIVTYTATVNKALGMMVVNIPVLSAGIYYVIPTWNPQDLSDPNDPYIAPIPVYGKGVVVEQ